MQNGYDHRFPQPRNPWKQLKYEEKNSKKIPKNIRGDPLHFWGLEQVWKIEEGSPLRFFPEFRFQKTAKGPPLCFLEIFLNDTLYSSIVSMVFGVVEHDGASSFAPNTFPTLIYGIEYLVPTHSDPKTLKNNMENL